MILGHTPGHGLLGTLQRRTHKSLAHYSLSVPGLGPGGVFIHKARQQFLVKAAPVHTNTNGPVKPQGRLNHGPKLAVALGATAHIAWVNSVLRKRGGTLRHLGQELMAIEMKVAHQGNGAAHFVELLAYGWHLAGGLEGIDSNTYNLGAGKGKVAHLNSRCNGVGRVRVGHGLHHHWGISPHENLGVAPLELHLFGLSARQGAAGHGLA